MPLDYKPLPSPYVLVHNGSFILARKLNYAQKVVLHYMPQYSQFKIVRKCPQLWFGSFRISPQYFVSIFTFRCIWFSALKTFCIIKTQWSYQDISASLQQLPPAHCQLRALAWISSTKLKMLQMLLLLAFVQLLFHLGGITGLDLDPDPSQLVVLIPMT